MYRYWSHRIQVLVGPVIIFLYANVYNRDLIPPTQYERTIPDPPRKGWSSWNFFRCDITEAKIMQQAVMMKERGLLDAGYKTIDIDDCWQSEERVVGEALGADPTAFPRGMGPLIGDLKDMGFEVGLYTDAGVKSCEGRPGSGGHFEEDLREMNSWGVSHIKVDRCGLSAEEDKYPSRVYEDIAEQFGNYPITMTVCNWGRASPWRWASRWAQSWRISTDIYTDWSSIPFIVTVALDPDIRNAQKLGHYNDLDSLVVGVPVTGTGWFLMRQFTPIEEESHFLLWAMFGTPLILGFDAADVSDEVIALVTNPEVLEVSTLGASSVVNVVEKHTSGIYIGAAAWCPFGNCKNYLVLSRKLSDGRLVVTATNFGDANMSSEFKSGFDDVTITISWVSLGFDPETPLTVRDVGARKEEGAHTDQFTTLLVAHQTRMFVFQEMQGWF